MKYTKKPVTIEALRWTLDNLDEIKAFVGDTLSVDENPHLEVPVISINTMEGTMTVGAFDWVIKGVKGEFYPCKPDIFDATYEPAREDVADNKPPHQQRVLKEFAELADRRGKLHLFIESNPVFETLPEAERERLVRQLSCMTEYSAILEERMAAFPSA